MEARSPSVVKKKPHAGDFVERKRVQRNTTRKVMSKEVPQPRLLWCVSITEQFHFNEKTENMRPTSFFIFARLVLASSFDLDFSNQNIIMTPEFPECHCHVIY